jgi:hypothetical protein
VPPPSFSPSSSPPFPPPVTAEALLTNLDEFSLGILDFSDPKLGSIVHDAEAKILGNSSLRFELVGGDPVVWRIREPIPCKAGQLYMLEARMRCFLLGSAGMKMFVEWLDSADQPIHVGTLFWGQKLYEDSSDWIGATASWNPERLVVRAPETAARVRFGCRFESVRLRASCHPADGMKVTGSSEVWMDVAAGGKAVHQGTVALEGVEQNTEVPLRFEGKAEGFRIPATVVYFKQAPTRQ